jgi:hypothetical protein
MSGWLEKEIRTKHEHARDILLSGAALDYTAYASAVARYRVLDELLNDIKDRRKSAATGDDPTDD